MTKPTDRTLTNRYIELETQLDTLTIELHNRDCTIADLKGYERPKFSHTLDYVLGVVENSESEPEEV